MLISIFETLLKYLIMLDYQLMYMKLKNVAAKVQINCGQITSQGSDESLTDKISRFSYEPSLT